MKIHLPKEIYLSALAVMKKILDLLAFKFDKKSDEYLYLRKEIMDFTYNSLKKLFTKLETTKIIKRCPKQCSLRQGYTNCEFCNGSGYINFE